MLKIGRQVVKYADIIAKSFKSNLIFQRCISSHNLLNITKKVPTINKYALLTINKNNLEYDCPINNRISHNKYNELPPLLPNKIIENPRDSLLNEINDIINNNSNKEISTPPSGSQIIEKQATRLIVIRRRKMKKHKLRKLRKKMKFEWAKVRQRREMRKEKAFQAELIEQIKEAEKFSAEQYVNEKLKQIHEILPKSSSSTKL